MFRRLYGLFRWLYPITIFAIAMTAVATAVEQLGRRITPIVLFLAVGLPLVALPVLSTSSKLQGAFGSVVCAVLLLAGVTVLRRRGSAPPAPVHSGFRYFTFLALMFFGSLWFSWQIEMDNSRNTIPYLPLWLLLLAIAGMYWKTIGSRTMHAVAAPPEAASGPS